MLGMGARYALRLSRLGTQGGGIRPPHEALQISKQTRSADAIEIYPVFTS